MRIQEINEGGMPASVIKAKQRWSMMQPEEMLAAFTEVSQRTGKSVQDLALSAARRHGYKDVNTYWNRIKGLVVNESFPYDVDHMPGATRKDLAPKGCTTCNGHGHVYTLNGKLIANNPGQGAKRIVCPTCKGK